MPSFLVATAPVWGFPLPSGGHVYGHTTAQNCREMGQIYTSGKELCEKMWGTAFRYERNESLAYTMWFFDAENPNDEVSSRLGKGNATSCHLKGEQERPGQMSPTLAECHPWRSSACCSQREVATLEKLKQRLGAGFQWDRCGPLSQECERFFVQEACFYECDPNAGLYRKYNESAYDPRCDAENKAYQPIYAASLLCSHNQWELHQLPVRASYCDAWFAACHKEHFCADASGDFFSCEGVFKAVDMEAQIVNNTWGALSRGIGHAKEVAAETLLGMMRIALAAVSAVAVSTCAFGCFLIHRERQGKLFEASANAASPSLMGAQSSYLELS